jgi:hypothetical protein
VEHAAVRSQATGPGVAATKSGPASSGCVRQRDALMRASRFARMTISCTAAERKLDRRSAIAGSTPNDGVDDNIRGFKIDSIQSSAKAIVGRIVGRSQGFGSELGEPRFLSNPPLQQPNATPCARTLTRAATPRASPVAPRGRATLERDLGVRC